MLKYFLLSSFLNRVFDVKLDGGEIRESGGGAKAEAEKKLVSENERRGIIRVKVRMTKVEAERLLSKCKEGGILEFRDVARELVQIPPGRVAVVSPGDGGSGLQSIPEE